MRRYSAAALCQVTAPPHKWQIHPFAAGQWAQPKRVPARLELAPFALLWFELGHLLHAPPADLPDNLPNNPNARDRLRWRHPDATITLDFLLSRLNGVVKNLVVHQDNMNANMNKFKGLVFSQGVMLKLTQKGVKREDAYKTVQSNAMKTWDNHEDFYTNLSKDKLIKKHLTTKELEKLFDLNYHTKNVNYIFSRVFKK